MKAILLIVSCLMLVAAKLPLEKIDFFFTANDFLDVHTLVNDPIKFKTMADCFIDEGPCDEEAQSYKDVIPEAVRDKCKRCNSPQKHLGNIFYNALKVKMPEVDEKFWEKYDPEKKYRDGFMDSLKGF